MAAHGSDEWWLILLRWEKYYATGYFRDQNCQSSGWCSPIESTRTLHQLPLLFGTISHIWLIVFTVLQCVGLGKASYPCLLLDDLPTEFFCRIPVVDDSGGLERRSWHRRGAISTSESRREIYRRNQFVDPTSLVDATGRYRECSPEWYRYDLAAERPRLYLRWKLAPETF